jgi:ABC-type multidrug transport system fused ATPase/permease subunit
MKKHPKRPKSSSLVRDLRQLFSFVSRRRQRQLALLLLLMVVSSISEMVSLGAVFPFLGALSNPDSLLDAPRLQPILGFLNIDSQTGLVYWLAAAFIVAAIVANSLRLVTINAKVRLSAAIGSDLSCQIYQKTLHQPYSFHVMHNSSDLMEMITADTARLTAAILSPLLTILTDILLASSLLGALVLIDGRVAIAASVLLGGSYLSIYRLRQKLLKRNSKVIAQAGQGRIKAVQEGLGGIRDVLIANTQDYFQRTFQNSEMSLKHAQASNSLISQTPQYVMEGIAMSAIALLALALGRDGDFSQAVPVLGSLSLGAKRLLPVLQGMFTAIAKIQGARASLERSLVALQRPVDPLLLSSATRKPLFLEKELFLDNIWFRYSAETDWVLRGLNLKIAAKTTVGFVGSTGSGKSTTADLIMGLLQPHKGHIWADGQLLEGEQLRRWQQGIAHVPQSIFLMDATIAENIAFGIPKSHIDFTQVKKAAKLAQIDTYIESLPAQYDSYVGERGIRLSGGQRQRIGIARALYRPASVIVFDEATSALDNATEREVMAAIEGLSGEFTVILIAHRLSTVKHCDLVVELHQGQVAAQGDYRSLLQQSKSFREMAGKV